MNQLMTGAVAMGFAVAAVFFLRFWRRTGDRLFGIFAVAFLVLAINRVAIGLREEQHPVDAHYYWVRFVGFAIILLAIIDKNRSK